MNEKSLKILGKPNIKLAGLQIWVHGRQYPDTNDYWDGNWLKVTACCEAKGASVWTNGPIIHLSELQSWMISTKELSKTLKGEAKLLCMEQELFVTLKAESLGHIAMNVEITPSINEQEHRFSFELDQSYLPSLVSQCDEVLKNYQIRGDSRKS